MKHLMIVLFLIIISSNSAVAESARRGLVTSGLCPLSCEDLGVPLNSCKEWSAGQKCFVEDMRSPAGHRSVAIVSPIKGAAVLPKSEIKKPLEDSTMSTTEDSSNNLASIDDSRRGLITSSSCPYTCLQAGVPAQDCRESKTGSTCSVEDLRQAPGHRSLLRVKN